MSIKYQLKIHYIGTDENNNEINKTDCIIFDSENSTLNRQNVIREYENYSDIFNDAHKFGKLKFSWAEVLNKNIKEFHIPNLNIFYTDDYFSEEDEGIILFGSLLESFDERILELIDEKKAYDDFDCEYETELITDFENNEYVVLKGSLIKEDDRKYIKNIC
jgi:hypothetical protein